MNSTPPPETMKVLKPLAEQFQHRLKNHLGEQLVGHGMVRCRQPLDHRRTKFVRRLAGMRRRDDVDQGGITASKNALKVSRQHRFERLFILRTSTIRIGGCLQANQLDADLANIARTHHHTDDEDQQAR
jgi:hypothetical protein